MMVRENHMKLIVVYNTTNKHCIREKRDRYNLFFLFVVQEI